MGFLVGVSAACTVASPTSPSSTSGVGSAFNHSSSQRSVGLASFGFNAADILSATGEKGSQNGKGRNGARRAKRRQFCEALPPGHEKYEPCQKWLESRSKRKG